MRQFANPKLPKNLNFNQFCHIFQLFLTLKLKINQNNTLQTIYGISKMLYSRSCNIDLCHFISRPSLDYSEALAIREQVYNGTTEVTVEVAVIDLGNPPHGSVFNVTVNLSNTCLIDELFDRTNITFMINTTDSDGEFYLRIPGYWIVDFRKYHCLL